MSSSDLNLWSSFLRESSKRTQNQESTCIILGDDHCGKRKLSAMLCGQDSDKENSNMRNGIVAYNYFDIDDKDLEATARVNTWLFEKSIFDGAFDILKNTIKSDKLILVLALDLSKPERCLASLQKWLVKIHVFTQKYFSEISPDSARTQKAALLDYLKNVRKTKGSVVATSVDETEEDEESEELHFEGNFISDHYGLPIIVVGTKADTMVSETSAAMKQARELQGKIRSLCLEVGAALIYTSTVGPNPLNCTELKKYIMHRLYPNQIGMELSLEDKLETCFVPAGFDTTDMVKISCAVKHVAADCQAKLKADFAQKAAQTALAGSEESAENKEGEYKAELEGEQAWLSGLHDFIQQIEHSGSQHTRAISDGSAAQSGASDRASASATAGASTTNNSTSGAGAGDHRAGAGAGAGSGGAGELADKVASMGITEEAPARPVRATRRSTVANGEKKDVGDFFKNLLKK